MTEKELRKKYVQGIEEWVGMSRAKGTHKPIIDLYNSQKKLPRNYKVTYTDAYCATTTSAGAIKAGLEDIIPIECSCSKVIEIAKKMDIWVENDAYIPDMADLILYDWDDDGKGDDTGAPEHIGAVVNVTNGIIRVVEGNKSGNVAYRDIAVNGKYIRGFVTPNYASKATDDKKSDNCQDKPKAKGYTGTFPTIPSKGYLGSGDHGTQVKYLQKFLNWYGNYGLEVDGAFGPLTLAAVKKYQKTEKLTVDGQFGPKSLGRAKTVKLVK